MLNTFSTISSNIAQASTAVDPIDGIPTVSQVVPAQSRTPKAPVLTLYPHELYPPVSCTLHFTHINQAIPTIDVSPSSR